MQYLNNELTLIMHPNGRVVRDSVLAGNSGCPPVQQVSSVPDPIMNFQGQTVRSSIALPANATSGFYGENLVELEPGFSSPTGGTFTAATRPCFDAPLIYQYHLTDHLGNQRVLFEDANLDGTVTSAEIVEENHYYAFGMKMTGDWEKVARPDNRYRFNGIERNDELGLDLAFYRSYDPAIGRWLQVDPKAESFAPMSPYMGMGNNPISIIDPLGDSILIQVNSENVALYHDGKLTNAKTGEDYRGKGVKVTKDGEVKLRGFLKRAVSALDEVRTGGSNGTELIDRAQNDSDYYIIRQGGENQTSGRVITFNPYESSGGLDVNGNTSRPAFLGLAHELAHAIDADNGTIDLSTWTTASDGRVITNAEKYATYFENRVRNDHRIPLRAYYGIDKGKGIAPILKPGTTVNAHGGASRFKLR